MDGGKRDVAVGTASLHTTEEKGTSTIRSKRTSQPGDNSGFGSKSKALNIVQGAYRDWEDLSAEQVRRDFRSFMSPLRQRATVMSD